MDTNENAVGSESPADFWAVLGQIEGKPVVWRWLTKLDGSQVYVNTKGSDFATWPVTLVRFRGEEFVVRETIATSV